MKGRILSLVSGAVGSLCFIVGGIYCLVAAASGESFFGGSYTLGWITAVLMILFGGFFLQSVLRDYRDYRQGS